MEAMTGSDRKPLSVKGSMHAHTRMVMEDSIIDKHDVVIGRECTYDGSGHYPRGCPHSNS